ncbi:Metal tolerance protein 8 [Fusarium oxysporum f. sp. albedinis]|nr:Metal tolerance protein 8 [Fusarium oxysporum f. sp. albedinis]
MPSIPASILSTEATLLLYDKSQNWMLGGNLDTVGLMGRFRQELKVISILVLLGSVIGLWSVGQSCNRQLYHCTVNAYWPQQEPG